MTAETVIETSPEMRQNAESHSASALIPGAITLLLMTLFIGIVLWAWSDKPKRTFKAAERLPLEEDDLPITQAESADPTHKTGGRFA